MERVRVRWAGGYAGLLAAAALVLMLASVAQAKPPRQDSATSQAPQEAAVVNSTADPSAAPAPPEGTRSTPAPVEAEKAPPSAETISLAIRRALQGDKDLSSEGRKVDIIAENGTIVLRGPVNTPEEKQAIAKKAAEIAGSAPVSDQMKVLPLKGHRAYGTGRIW